MTWGDWMFICLDCGLIFSEPVKYTERHGLDTPPYEQFSGCPDCGGAYDKTYQCDACGCWIGDDYIKVSGYRICSDCYEEKTIGEEDDD